VVLTQVFFKMPLHGIPWGCTHFLCSSPTVPLGPEGEPVVAVELIELIDGSLVAAFTKFLSAFLEDELLGKRSAVAANAAIDIEDQLCKDGG